MKNVVRVLLVSILVLILSAGCTPKPTPTINQPQPTAVPPTATKAPEVPAWQKKWDETLAAAKKEGKVTIYGELGPKARAGLTEAFKKRFGIELEVVTGSAREIAAKYIQETKNNIYLADVIFNGDSTFLTIIKPAGVLRTMEPHLILPDVKDPTVWAGGSIPFLDKDRIVAQTTIGRNIFAVVNTDLVKEGEIKSFQDYLNPKWKGKIVMWDPTKGGATAALFSLLLTQVMGPVEGEKYLRKLAEQEPIIMAGGDKRLPVEWIAKGKYPILIGPSMQPTIEFKNAGAPIDGTQEKEAFLMHPSSSNFALTAKGSNPNAAIVLANWLLTAEAGAILSEAWGASASRLDVSTAGIDPMRLAIKDSKMYLDSEELVLQNPTTYKVSQAVFGHLMK